MELPKGGVDPISVQIERVAGRLRYLRRKQGFTAKEAAKRAGVSHESISFMESGRQAITLRTLIKLSMAYGVTLKDIFVFPEGEVAPRYPRGYQPRKGQIKL